MKTIAFLLALLVSAVATADDNFYSQYFPRTNNIRYSPTIQYSLEKDTSGDYIVVAIDDPNLRFNYMWLESFQPGYKRFGGAVAFREIARQYFVSGYKQQRDNYSETFKNTPDENGSGKISENFVYRIVANGPEFKLRIQYNF